MFEKSREHLCPSAVFEDAMQRHREGNELEVLARAWTKTMSDLGTEIRDTDDRTVQDDPREREVSVHSILGRLGYHSHTRLSSITSAGGQAPSMRIHHRRSRHGDVPF